jgi:hypothetical protein
VTVTSAADPVVEELTATTDAVASATDAVTAAASDASATAASATAPVVEAVASTTDAVASATDAVTTAAAAVSSTVEAVMPSADSEGQPPDGSVPAEAPVAGALPPPAESIPPPAEGPSIEITTPAAPPSLEPIAPVAGLDPTLPTTLVRIPPIDGLDPTLPTTLLPIPPIDGLGDTLPTTLVELPPGLVAEPATPLSEPTIADPIFPLPELDPSELLPVLSVGAAVLGAAVMVRGVCSPSPTLLATNVRLFPLFAHASVQQATATATSAVSKVASEGATLAKSVREESIVGTVREGFDRVVRGRGLGAGGEESADSRLIAQIGVVLGTIYLAFLTVWFWATRLRWNARM